MRRPDPLLMSADVTLLEAERPDLDVELIAAIYGHLLEVEGRQPTLAEVREYVDHVLSYLGEGMLRQHLGLEVRQPRRRPPAVERPTGASARRGHGVGRPRGTGLLTVEAVRAAHRAVRAERGRQPTQEELASALDVAVRSLQRFLKRHDMGWPLGE
ncbi:MAG TPA: hypothetical protein VLH81_07710 [Desulfobacterales bacterium]|nr:hypothetical protein [Desulfobacterales bacterium]